MPEETGSDYKNSHTRSVMNHHQRRVAAGMMRLGVYVPRERRDEFYVMYNELRDKWAKDGYDI